MGRAGRIKPARRAVGLLVCLSLCLIGCLAAGCQKTLQKYTQEVYGAFDTVIQITAYAENQAQFDELAQLAEDELLRLSQLYDIYTPYQGVQGLYQLNQQAGQGPVKLEPEALDLLEFGQDCFRLTEGRVNVAMGAVLSIWHDLRLEAGQNPDQARLPRQEDLEAAAEHCRMEDLIVDRQAGTAELRDPKMRLDVGAVAKGYAVQQVTETLEEAGYRDFILSAGGNVQAQGTPPDRDNWTVGVQSPEEPGKLVAAIEVSDMAVVTSGGYERFYTVEGRQYHHIVDPSTLYPAERMLSATVICPEGGLADCLSTALFLTEPQEALEFVRTIPNARAVLTTLDGEILDSAGLLGPDRLE